MLQQFARRQHSIFTLTQALESGYTRPRVRRKLATGEWQEVESRVYRVAAAGPLGWRARLMALTLSSKGVASHASAAALYGLSPPPKHHEITVARRARSCSTAWAHSSAALGSRDITTVDRIPATTPARTVIDVAGSMPIDQFEDLLDLAIVATMSGTFPLGADVRVRVAAVDPIARVVELAPIGANARPPLT
jgi:hypothetical protein